MYGIVRLLNEITEEVSTLLVLQISLSSRLVFRHERETL